ncbi:exodeoxyribonuclease V subunit alpha [Nocardia sp. NPDC019395]|uniref:exodeoxyribonuclease V subunit alpha n=1 Tax=Nocardia sp. NPDC019395 TaxID=3154686 RepID=UPI0033F885CC
MIPIRVALRGNGILREFNEAGVLSAADVHVAERLGRLAGETRDTVLFAAALAVRAVRSGSVCLDLTGMREIGVDADDERVDQVDLSELPWPEEQAVIDALRDSPLVCGGPAGPLCPLRLTEPARPDTGPLLYLDRYYRQEQTIRRVLTARAAGHPPADPAVVCRELDRLFGPAGDTLDRQRLAAALAATHWTTVVAGGPGTGKTHTIARILALLSAHGAAGTGPGAGTAPLRIALAAPTGKAAARLQEAVRDQAGPLGLPELSAATLHRLLGWQRGRTTRFRYHEHNRLPYDVVVVDETSMVSLTMMSRLLAALRPDTRLVLAGDPDQLASVDAGAVLADLVASPFPGAAAPVFEEILAADPGFAGRLETAGASAAAESEALTDLERNRLRGGIVRLTRGRRFGGRIADLAVAVRAGDTEAALDLLRSGGDMLQLLGPDEIAAVRADVVSTAQRVTAAANAGDAAGALAAFESHRLLCAHRRGPYGVEQWDRTAAEWAAAAGAGPESRAGTWYPGQPLLVTANDHEARIYNGDTGVVLRRPDGSLRVALQRGEEPLLVHPTQFPSVVTVFAMTIHRSQGSQYDAVTIVLPEPGSSLLTRELLYTAITRARRHVRILGSEEAIRAAIDRHVLRASGLSLDHADRPD